MKNFIKGLILFIIIAGLSLIMPGLMDSTKYSIKAGEAEWAEDGSEEVGQDAFTVVEIVPYRGMAEIGYLVDGQEPIDEELLSINSASGELSFLGDAISVYWRYEEKPLPESGQVDSGWYKARTVEFQNGYFENIGYNKGGKYVRTNGTNYLRVEDGTGTHAAVLNGEMINTYNNIYNTVTNYKNVKAYFVYGRPSGVALYNYTTYGPISVTENPNRSGDYDYNVENGRFILNKGQGKYDVLFGKVYGDRDGYYMLDDYEIVDDNSGDYSFEVRYVARSGGNYILDPSASYFTYNEWSANYRFVQNEEALAKPSNYYEDISGRIWVKNQRIIKEYQYTYHVKLMNNELFKQNSLGIPADQVDNYSVRVITITPEDLSRPENLHYIDDADLFYINAKYDHNLSYLKLYEYYSYEGRDPSKPKYYTSNNKENSLNFALHDLSWEATERLFKRIAGIGCYKASVVVDSTYVQKALQGSGAYASLWKSVNVSYNYNNNGATMCNLAKLYIMINQRNMVDFYNSFMNPETTSYLITQVNSSLHPSGTTGSFRRPDSTNPSPTANEAIYWNGNTFLPYGLNAEGKMVRFADNELVSQGIVNYNLTRQPTDLTDNVLSTNGSDIFTAKFTDPNFGWGLTDSWEEIYLHYAALGIELEWGQVPTVSIGNIVNVITNNGSGYQNVGGISYPDGSNVEGPPSGIPNEDEEDISDDGLDGSGIRNFKRVLNIQPTADFASSESQIKNMLTGYNVQIVNMTSTQFNGSIEDINAMYDLIYIGSGAGRFNLSGGNTVFNNTDPSTPSLNKYIYFVEGDSIRIKDSNEKTVFYRGNDISSRKREELKSFLDAGYPLVLDSGMYNLTNVKTNTNIYAFINQVKNDHPDNFMNYANYTNAGTQRSFKAKLQNALNIVRPRIDLLAPIIDETATSSYVYVDPATDLLSIRFSILPRSSLPSVFKYNAYLYVDENCDGIFDESERVQTVSTDGSTWENLSESRYRTYTFNYNMSDMNGVYQWKLLVRRTDNNQIRSTVTGYAANQDKKTLYILHIRDNSSSYDLGSRSVNSSSLIYQLAGENKLSDYTLRFESMTVSDFEKLYQKEPYSSETAAETNKLSKYHLLIMDNPTKAITNSGAINNIKDELADDLSVIFTKNALSYSNQFEFLGASKASLLDKFTYNYINNYAEKKYQSRTQYYIYNSLSINGDLTKLESYNTNFLTKTNEGTISRYPYQINNAIRISNSYYSNYATIDLTLPNQKLIGWYCLADNMSPAVINAGLAPEKPAGDLYKGLYSSSPNDVKNNYYLFSFGRCFYSGIHLSTADVAGNTDEIKLFVNTIIAAYEASGRGASNPPTIALVNPEYDDPAAVNKSITIKSDDISGTDFILTFEISESSSAMDLTVLYNGLNPTGNWNDIIYKADGTSMAINNTDKVVTNGIYRLKIPISELVGSNTLSLKAENRERNKATLEVTLINQQLPEVTIDRTETDVVSNSVTDYIYVDINYNSLDLTEGYLEDADEVRVVFQVDKSMTDVILNISSDGVDLSDGIGDEVVVYPYEDDLGTKLNFTTARPKGKYVMYIPKSLMKNYNSREIIVKATDLNSNSGEASITLLRRSLFPLD